MAESINSRGIRSGTLALVCLPALFGTTSELTAQSAAPPEAHYVVGVRPAADAPPRLEVRARLPSGTRQISYEGPSVGIEPAEWHARWVDALAAQTVAGTPVELLPLEPGRWAVEGAGEEDVVLTYVIDGAVALTRWPAGNEHAAFWEDESLYALGEVLFATSDAAGGATVEFDVPADWRISTPWSRLPLPENAFRVESRNELLDNAVVMGRHAAISHEAAGFRYALALVGRAAAAGEDARSLSRSLLDAYVDLFGGGPEGAYLQAMLVSDAEDGEALSSSSGFRTTLVPDRRNVLLWGNQLAHELFHRWMASDAAIAPTSYEDSQWLSEGMAEYYANLTLLRLDAISLDQWLSKLEKHLGLYLYYRASPAFGASLKAAGAAKGRERLAVYNGGWTAAFCLDVHARRESGGARSLDSFMSALWDRYGATGRPYEFSDLPRVYRESTGVVADTIFADYIAGTRTFPVEECLRDAGFEAGVKPYAAEIWVWENRRATPEQRAVRAGLLSPRGMERE